MSDICVFKTLDVFNDFSKKTIGIPSPIYSTVESIALTIAFVAGFISSGLY
jgi:hypothetical protein